MEETNSTRNQKEIALKKTMNVMIAVAVVLALVLAAVMMAAVTAVVALAVVLSSETLASWLTIPIVFFAAVVMYASYWPMYRDLFGDLN